MKSVRIVIVGRVQGVAYRAWTQREAGARGLGGFVRNRDDGTVEAAFTGPAAAVDAMIEACRIGPPGARVERIDMTATDADTGAAGFDILR